MAVAFVVGSESHTGTTGNTSSTTYSWSHAHTAGQDPEAVVVFVFSCGAGGNTNPVTSVDYGGVTLNAVSSGEAACNVSGGEPGNVKAYFIGSGLSGKTGTQTVTVNRTSNTVISYASCLTFSASGNCETAGVTLLQGNSTAAFSEQSVDDGSPGTNSVRCAGGYYGGNSPAPAGGSSTLSTSIDLGSYGCATVYETTAGQGARSIGFASGTDDRAGVHLAVREIPSSYSTTRTDALSMSGEGANVKLTPLTLACTDALDLGEPAPNLSLEAGEPITISRTDAIALRNPGQVDFNGARSFIRLDDYPQLELAAPSTTLTITRSDALTLGESGTRATPTPIVLSRTDALTLGEAGTGISSDLSVSRTDPLSLGDTATLVLTPLVVRLTDALDLGETAPTLTFSSGTTQVGSGFTDGSGRQIVRTSAGRLYTVANTCTDYPDLSSDGLSQRIHVYKSDDTGAPPASFTLKDTANEPTAALCVSAALDGSDNIHIAWLERDSWGGEYLGHVASLRYAVFNTSTDTWGSKTTIFSNLDWTDTGQGDEGVAIAVDLSGKAHIAFLSTNDSGVIADRRIYYTNNVSGSWAAQTQVDSGVTYTSNQKAWHPGICFDTTGRLVVTWLRGSFNANNDGTIYIRTRETSGSWNTEVSHGSGLHVGIDQCVSLMVTSDNRYHLGYTNDKNYGTGSAWQHVQYAYSDNNGGSWSTNHPTTQLCHNVTIGPGTTGKIRLWIHDDIASTPLEVYYFEGTGGSGSWGSLTQFSNIGGSHNAECTIAPRWSMYHHHQTGIIDVAWWHADYADNKLWVGSKRFAIAPAATDALTLGEARQAVVTPLVVRPTDAVTLGDSRTVSLPLTVKPTEAITLGEGATRVALTPLVLARTDALTLADSRTLALTPLVIQRTDPITLGESRTLALTPLSISRLEDIGLGDTCTVSLPITPVCTDAVPLGDSARLMLTPLVTSRVETLGVTDTGEVHRLRPIGVLETVSITIVTVPAGTYQITLTDAFALGEGNTRAALTPLVVQADDHFDQLHNSAATVSLINAAPVTIARTDAITLGESAKAVLTPLTLARTDAITLGDTRTAAPTPLVVRPTDALTLGDSRTVTCAASAVTVARTDALTLGEANTRVRPSPLVIRATDATALGDSRTAAPSPLVIRSTDAVTLGEARTVKPSLAIQRTDALTLGDTRTVKPSMGINRTDALTVSDATTKAKPTPLVLRPSDTLTLGEGATRAAPTPLVIARTDSFDQLHTSAATVSVGAPTALTHAAADTIGLSAHGTLNAARPIGVTDALVEVRIGGRLYADPSGVKEVVTPYIAGTVSRQIVTDTLTWAATATVQLVSHQLLLWDTLAVGELLDRSYDYPVGVSEFLRVVFLGKSQDRLGVQDALAGIQILPPKPIETLGLSEFLLVGRSPFTRQLDDTIGLRSLGFLGMQRPVGVREFLQIDLGGMRFSERAGLSERLWVTMRPLRESIAVQDAVTQITLAKGGLASNTTGVSEYLRFGWDTKIRVAEFLNLVLRDLHPTLVLWDTVGTSNTRTDATIVLAGTTVSTLAQEGASVSDYLAPPSFLDTAGDLTVINALALGDSLQLQLLGAVGHSASTHNTSSVGESLTLQFRNTAYRHQRLSGAQLTELVQVAIREATFKRELAETLATLDYPKPTPRHVELTRVGVSDVLGVVISAWDTTDPLFGDSPASGARATLTDEDTVEPGMTPPIVATSTVRPVLATLTDEDTDG